MENSTYTTSRNNIFLSYIAFVLFSGFWYVFGIIVAFNLGKFTLRWIESTGSFPQWINAGSFGGWVLFVLALAFLIYLVKKLVVLFSNLIWNIVRLVFSDSPRIVRIALALYVIVFNVLLITVAYFLTHQWFNFAGEHYEFNDFYAYSGKLIFILHVFWVYGALTQKIKFD